MKNLILLLIVFLNLNLLAQAPDTLWTKTYGGAGLDFGYNVFELEDGFVIGGETGSWSYTGYEGYLMKTDLNGDTLWLNIYGETDHLEGAECVVQTFDDGYALGGVSNLGGGNTDTWVVKTDESGTQLWDRYFGYDSLSESITSICQTYDSGLVMTTHYWASVVGNVFSIRKIDKDGTVLWNQPYHFEPYGWGHSAHYIMEASDSSLIITGETGTMDKAKQVFIMKTDEFGDSLWMKKYGGVNSEQGIHVTESADGSFLIAGNTESFGSGGKDHFYLKTNSMGDSIWAKWYGGGYHDGARCVRALSDGGYISSGSVHDGVWNAWILRLDADGDTLWTKKVNKGSSCNAYDIIQTSDGGYVFAGQANPSSENGIDIFIGKLDVDPVGITEQNDNLSLNFKLQQNYPNPFNPKTVISYQLSVNSEVELIIYNALGQKIEMLISGIKTAGEHQIEWNATQYASGVYYYQLKTGQQVQTRKMLFLK